MFTLNLCCILYTRKPRRLTTNGALLFPYAQFGIGRKPLKSATRCSWKEKKMQTRAIDRARGTVGSMVSIESCDDWLSVLDVDVDASNCPATIIAHPLSFQSLFSWFSCGPLSSPRSPARSLSTLSRFLSANSPGHILQESVHYLPEQPLPTPLTSRVCKQWALECMENLIVS